MNCPICGKPVSTEASFWGVRCGNVTCPIFNFSDESREKIVLVISAARADAYRAGFEQAREMAAQVCADNELEIGLVLQNKIRATPPEPQKYCPDCEKPTQGHSVPEPYALHRCADHGILFDPQLDEWPGQTHGKPGPQ